MSKSKGENPIYPGKTEKKVREKFNWKPYVIIFAVIALLLGSVAFNIYLVNGYFKDYSTLSNQVEFEYVRGAGYHDVKNDVIYRPAPSYYEPASIVQEPVYGRVGGVNLFTPGKWDDITHLYAVCYPVGDLSDKKYERADPTVWLATDSYHGSTVYCNENYNLPEPKDFQFGTLYLCDADGKIATHELDDIASSELMEKFFDENSENLFDTVFPLAHSIKSVRVTSTRYSWLHLVLYLYTYGGEYYFYLPEMARFVQTDREVFEIYFATPDDLGAQP